jgi:3',5'-cyclic AMP phosphodiesterase CpdA
LEWGGGVRMSRRQFLQWLGMASITPMLKVSPWQANGTSSFRLPPTVLHVTSNTVTIYFILTKPIPNAMLVIEAETEEPHHIFLSPDETRQLIEVNKLTPATVYTYRIEADEAISLYYETEWNGGSFKTVDPDPTAPIRFAVIGDSGYGESTTTKLVGHMVAREPDFMLHLGDMVYNSDEYDNDLWLNWALKYYQPFQPLLQIAPHYAAMGNHDAEKDNRLDGVPFYYTAYPPLDDMPIFQEHRSWYSFAVNDVQFISLNTQTFYTEKGLAEQTTWLEERLADTTFRTNILFSHIPFYTSSSVHPHDGDVVAQQWRHIFAEHADRIAVVLGGHQHLYERIIVDNITHITSGGGSAVIYPKGEVFSGSQFIYSTPHYVWVEITGNQLQLSAYDRDDNLLEAVSWEI